MVVLASQRLSIRLSGCVRPRISVCVTSCPCPVFPFIAWKGRAWPGWFFVACVIVGSAVVSEAGEELTSGLAGCAGVMAGCAGVLVARTGALIVCAGVLAAWTVGLAACMVGLAGWDG
jgi:hypothetical protein